MKSAVSEFLQWWIDPSSNPRFPDRFLRPVRYRHGGGMDDEAALWLIGQSLGQIDVSILSESEDVNCSRVELVCTDPVTLLRHRHRFEVVVEDDQILSVIEEFEMIAKT